MGRPKQLLEFQGETLVHRMARMALDAGCEPVIAVLGCEAEAVAAALSDLRIGIVSNDAWSEGVASSIRAGIAALPMDLEAALLLVCDQPMVDAAFLEQMLEAHQVDERLIVASNYADTTGVPALFPAIHFEALRSLKGDQGAKSMLNDAEVIGISLPGGDFDLDRPEDWDRLMKP